MPHHHPLDHPRGSTISAGDPHMSYLASPFISRRALLFVRIVIALFTVSTCLTVMIYSATHARGGGNIIRTGGGVDGADADADAGANTTSSSGGDAGQFLYFSYFTSLSFIGLTTWTVIQAVGLARMVWFGHDIVDEARVDRGEGGKHVDEEETRSEKDMDEEKTRVSIEELGETGINDSGQTGGPGGERRGWKVLNVAYEVLYSTITTFPILVTIIYWALLASPSTFATSYSAYSSTSQHIMNAVISLAETFVLTSSPSTSTSPHTVSDARQRKTNLPYIYLPITVVLLGLYLCVAYITNASQGVYVYPFLNPSKGPRGILAAYILGIGLAQCVVYVCIRWGVMLRDRAIRA